MADNWTETTFDEAVYTNPPVPMKRGEQYFFVDMKSVEPVHRTVSESEIRKFKGGGSRFMPYDTLMARITPCLENGKIARYVPSDGNSPAHGSTEFIVIRGREGVTDNDFAYYLTRGETFRSFAIVQMTGSSGRQRVPVESLKDFIVSLPPLPEQRAIAHILGTLDDKIELNRRMNKTLEEIARAIFKKTFIEPMEGGFPNGWREGKVEELILLSKETINPSEFSEETFYHYSIPAYDEGRLPKVVIGEQIQSNKFIVPTNAVLISKLNPRIPRVWFPNIKEYHRSVCSTEFLVAIPKKIVSREYLYTIFTSQIFLDVFATLVTGTSGSHQRVKPEYLLAMDLAIPPQKLMDRFTEIVRPLYKRIAINLDESRTLAILRDTLLPKLLSGQIRVKI
jgi:type I restriction enzyme S subunit